jgi:hypothetical protein
MVAVGVVVHLFLCLRVDTGEASAESLPGRGVSVNIGGVVALLGGVFWDASCLVFVFQVETRLRFFGGATAAASAPFPS